LKKETDHERDWIQIFPNITLNKLKTLLTGATKALKKVNGTLIRKKVIKMAVGFTLQI